MADRFGSDVVERALAMQEGSVLANEVLRLREMEARAIEVYREPPVEPCDHAARGTAVRILGYRPSAFEDT